MSDTLRVAVVGAGMAGQAHAFGYRNASMAHDLADLRVELAAIVDPNEALATSVRGRYGFERVETSIEAMLADESIDIVSVALPNNLYADVLPKVLAAGKHLFAEKPLGRSVAEATELSELARRSGVTTGIGFSFRRLPGLAAVADVVASGRLGRIHHSRAWYHADYALDPQGPYSWRYDQETSGGGAVLDIGAHAIDALQFVAGPVAAVLGATLSTVITERPVPARAAVGHGKAELTGRTAPVTNDDVAVLTLELADGSVSHVELSRIAAGTPNSLGVVVHGENGHVSFDSMSGGEFHVYENSSDTVTNGARRVITGPEHPYFRDVAPMPGAGVGTGYGEAFVAEIQHFLGCVRSGKPMDTDFDTALATMRVVETAQAVASRTTKTPVG